MPLTMSADFDVLGLVEGQVAWLEWPNGLSATADFQLRGRLSTLELCDAEAVGVHESTVSRAVSGKIYGHATRRFRNEMLFRRWLSNCDGRIAE